MASFATSYIPTTTATATRAADSASMTGTNFSSWFNASAGTFVVEYNTGIPMPNSARNYLVTFVDGGSNRLSIRVNDVGSTANLIIGTGVGTSAVNDPAATITNTVRKVAATWGASDIAFTSGGLNPNVTVTATAPVVTNVSFGQSAGSGNINGHIRSIRYYSTRLPNATLQSLTA